MYTKTRFPIYLLSLQLSAYFKTSIVRTRCIWNLHHTGEFIYEVKQQPSHAHTSCGKIIGYIELENLEHMRPVPLLA